MVFQIIKDSQGFRCKKYLFKGNLLFRKDGKPLCLKCVALDRLHFLSSGDTSITLKAKEYSFDCSSNKI